MEQLEKQYRKYKKLVHFFGTGIVAAFAFFLYTKYKKYLISNQKIVSGSNVFPLHKHEADGRTALIVEDSINYTLFLNLRNKNKANDMFDGSVAIEFDMKNVCTTFLDFHGIIKEIFVNGKKIEPDFWNDRISLCSSYLAKKNKVLIHFRGFYSNNEHGLKYSIGDMSECYVTSNFEPYYAHTVFPCFDQINLKAKVKLFVGTLKQNDVISSGKIFNYLRTIKSHSNRGYR